MVLSRPHIKESGRQTCVLERVVVLARQISNDPRLTGDQTSTPLHDAFELAAGALLTKTPSATSANASTPTRLMGFGMGLSFLGTGDSAQCK